MPSSTVENYLKAIYLATDHEATPSETPPKPPRVAMGTIARALGVVPGTATTMVKHLATQGFLDYRPRVGVRLTPQGEAIAVGILRRHRLIEYFLVESLGLPWDAIHDEAERLEHAVSDRVLDALDRFLGHPSADPHGDPIPSSQGLLTGTATRPLSTVESGETVVIARILDQDADFLRFVSDHGLRPGASTKVLETSATAETLMLRAHPDQKAFALSRRVAEKVLVAHE